MELGQTVAGRYLQIIESPVLTGWGAGDSTSSPGRHASIRGVNEVNVRPTRRIFGPLTYLTLALAAVLLIGRGVWWIWPEIHHSWSLRSLARDLGDEDLAVRTAAFSALAKAGSEATPYLLATLQKGNEQARRLAVSVLARMRPSSAKVISGLIRAIPDPDPQVRRAAIGSLQEIWLHYGPLCDGRLRDGAMRALCDAVGDQDWEVRRAAIWAMPVVDRSPGPHVPALERATGDDHPRVRAAATLTLFEYSPHGQRTIMALRELIADPSLCHEDLASHNNIKQMAGDYLKKSAEP